MLVIVNARVITKISHGINNSIQYVIKTANKIKVVLTNMLLPSGTV